MIHGINTSNEKSTPPIGAPKATETPAAQAADMISRLLASFRAYFLKRRVVTFPIAHVRWTRGPWTPTMRPADTVKIYDFVGSTQVKVPMK